MSLDKYKKDVRVLDCHMDIEHTIESTTDNLMFMTLALLGEAGELANVVKKIVRNGETEELWKQFDEELADVLIYFVKLLSIAKVDFDKAWDQKHNVLYYRQDRLKKYTIKNRKLERR